MSPSAAQAHFGQDGTSFYDEITGAIQLEKGHVRWVQPWGSAAANTPVAIPKNGVTGRHYSRIKEPLGSDLVPFGGSSAHGQQKQSPQSQSHQPGRESEMTPKPEFQPRNSRGLDSSGRLALAKLSDS